MRPHTYATPKVLLEVAGKPIIGHIMDRLLAAGPDEVCVVVGGQSEQIESYLIREYDCRLSFVRQDDPKGLGDAVFRTREHFGNEPVLILLGDTIVDVDMSSIVGQGNVLGVREVDDPRRFGIVETEDGKVRRVVEKPEKPTSNLAIVGVYYFKDAGVLFDSLSRLIESGRRTRGEFQLTDALQLMVESGAVMTVKQIDHWLDCGTPDALLATNRHLLNKKSYFRPREGVVFIPPLHVHDSASISASVIGPDVSVGAEAEIRDAVIRDCIVNHHALAEGVLLEHSILGEKSIARGKLRRLNLGAFSELEIG